MARTKKKVLKTTELRFRMKNVRTLLAHAKGCEEFLPMKPGEEAKEPGLVLVAEHSVFLVSNGKDDKAFNSENRICYAEKMNPSDWDDEFDLIDARHELVGRNDDTVFMRARDLEIIMGKCEGWELLRISVVHDGEKMLKVLMLPAMRTSIAPENELLKEWVG
jgi:hypothetical protein